MGGAIRETKVAPVIIAPANAVAATGCSWKYLRDNYPHLVRRIGPRKSGIIADELVAELRRREREREPVTVEDYAEQARRMLGKKKRRS